MDIKSKNYKYSLLTKAGCLVLSIVMFVMFAFNATSAIMPFKIFDYFGQIGNARPVDFYSLKAVGNRVYNNSTYLIHLMNPNQKELGEQIENQREKIINSQLNAFLDNKAEIIKNELLYVVHYAKPDSYDKYNNTGVSDYYVNSIPDTPVDKQEYIVDPSAPNSVKAAQKILNYAKGHEFLKYADLIRKSALTDDGFYSACKIGDSCSESVFISYDTDSLKAKEIIETNFENLKRALIDQSSYNWAEEQIKSTDNFFYYVQKGDKVVSNISSFDKEFESIKKRSNYYYKNDDASDSTYFIFKYQNSGLFDGFDKVLIYCAEPEDIKGDDEIATMYETFNDFNYDILPYCVRAVAFFLAAVTAAVILIVLSGHKNGKEGITLAFIDKLPGDIHLILTGGATAIIISLSATMYDIDNGLGVSPEKYVFIGLLTLIWVLLIERITSITRTAKSDKSCKSYFRRYFIVKIVVLVFRFFKKLFGKIKKAFKTVLGYKPEKFKRNVILGAVVYTLLKAIFLVFNSLLGFVMLAVSIGLFFVFDLIIAFWFANYAKNLDKIIVASTERKSVDFDNEKVNESLVILNNSLKLTNEEVSAAVEKAIKNERTKTELITNVSHDLKTPLTSIISYIGLLKKCDIKDENAQKYIEILNEKSYNLKNLFENLIEASKVSSGNIKLNKISLSLKELIVQAIVEYAPEFEERKLDLKFNEDTPAINVFADGQRTYRIIENLLSNAKKYSAPNTRVYISIREEDDYGVFEIKNISKEPLDISPEELTERFVRGDASRGEEEGNGLGLSIAKELCILQNGFLDLKIDGDLFKATVYLPRQ